MRDVKTIGLVGGGVIGAGWAARFLLNGYDVKVFDPDPEVERKVKTVLANAKRAQAKLTPGVAIPEGNLAIAASAVDAVTGADFVQESLPEREDLKRRVLAEIDAALPADVVIASSTSGLLPTNLQADMAHPERLVVGHPFNPVYLLPLVEVCGGAKTASDVVRDTAAFYATLGMHPLVVRTEIDGFIADRLLEALWREALWLVEDGVATTEEIDDAIRYGAGLRWSFMGTFLIYRLAGGEPGMRHFLSQFGPALKLPWTKLVAPELTDELTDRVSAQSDDQARGISIRELERLRDDCLVSVLSALAEQDYAAGAVVKAHRAALAARGRTEGEAAAPLALYRTEVAPDWIDYNGHMTESRYLHAFGEATDALLAHIGVDNHYLASGGSFYTVETHIMHLGEAHEGDELAVSTQLLGSDGKKLHLFHTLTRAGDAIATAEQMLLHVDTNAKRAALAPVAITERLMPIVAAHASLPRPASAGRHVGAPRG